MTALTAHDLAAGFADPTRDSQGAFRAILTALAEPGSITEVAAVATPAGLPVAAAAALLTLVDYETPVWLPEPSRDLWGRWITFHTGARIAAETVASRFGVIDGGTAAPALAAFDAGEDRYPDKSATLIVLCASLDGGPPITVSGPGNAAPRTIAPRGLRPGFWAEWVDNHGLFPRGVDLLLVAGSHLMGLPRTAAIREAR